MLAMVVGRETPYTIRRIFAISVAMKKETVMQIKKTISSLHSNIKLHLISCLSDNLLNNLDLSI